MNAKTSLSSLLALALIATACAKSTPRTAKSGQSTPGTPNQVSKTDQPSPPPPAREDQSEFNPICQNLKSLTGTWKSTNSEKGTTLTGTVTESKSASPVAELQYTSKEVITDSTGAKLKEYDAEYSYDRINCTFRKTPSRAQGYTNEMNRKILSIKEIDKDEVELKTQVCQDSLCTTLKDEIKIYSICLVNESAETKAKTEADSNASESLSDANSSELNSDLE